MSDSESRLKRRQQQRALLEQQKQEKRQRRKENLLTIIPVFIIVPLLLVVIFFIFNMHKDKNEEAVKKQEIVETKNNTAGYIKGTITAGALPDVITLQTIPSVSSDVKYKNIPSDTELGFSGRWFQKEVHGKTVMATVNEGAMFYFRVYDSDYVKIEFEQYHQLDMPYFSYFIDGKFANRQEISNGEIKIPDTGEHIVQVVIDGITEHEDKWNQEIGVAVASVEYSGKIIGVLPEQKRILFIGDSLTEGIMTLGEPAVAENNSAIHSYPFYTARMLQAEPFFIGYGGTGIVTATSFEVSGKAVDFFSAERLATIPACDLIVLNSGTNDFNVEAATFLAGYNELLEKLHRRYKDVKIVCMIPFSGAHSEEIKQACSDKDYAYCLETATWNFSTTETIHPNEEGSIAVAQYLSTYIKDVVGF